MGEATQLIAQVGFSGLIFFIWVLYHRSTMEIFKKIVDAQFQTLKDLIEINNCTISSLTRIEQKIDNNTWCPYEKERKKPK